MMTKYIFQNIAFLFVALMLVTCVGTGYAQPQSREELLTDFQSGRMVVINNCALVNADTVFLDTLIQARIIRYNKIDGATAKSSYGSLGQHGVIQIQVELPAKFEKINYHVVDASILKYLNQEDSMFYMIDGMPTHDIYNVIHLLIDKPIEKVQVLRREQAMAIWGRQGSRGATMINCDREHRLSIQQLSKAK